MGAFYGNVVTGNNIDAIQDISTIQINGVTQIEDITTLNFEDKDCIVISKNGDNTLLFQHKNTDIGAIDATNLAESIKESAKTFNIITYKFDAKGHCIETLTNTIDLSELFELISNNTTTINAEIDDRTEVITNLKNEIEETLKNLQDEDITLANSIGTIQSTQNANNIQINNRLDSLQRQISENTESIDNNTQAVNDELEKIAHKVSVIDLSNGTSEIDYPTVWAVYNYVRQQTAEIPNKEDLSNKTQTIVDDINKYPSSKAVLNALKLKENVLNKTDDFEKNINSKNYLSTKGLKDIMTPAFNSLNPSTSKNNIATDNYVLEALDSKPGQKSLNHEGAEIFNDYNNNKALSYYALAANENTQAKGRASIALNRDTEARGSYSAALGEGTTSQDTAQTVIGKYNEISSGAFIVGNGTKDDNRSNAFLIDWEGNTIQAGIITAADVKINDKLITESLNEKINLSSSITSQEIPQTGAINQNTIIKIDDNHYFTAAGTMNASYQTTMMLMDLFDVDKHIEQFENIPSAEFYGNELIFQFIGQTGNYKNSENDEGVDLYYGSFYKAHSPRDGAFTKFDLILPFKTTNTIDENSTNIQFVSAETLYNYLTELRDSDQNIVDTLNFIQEELQDEIKNLQYNIQTLEQTKATKFELENQVKLLSDKDVELMETIEWNRKDLYASLNGLQESVGQDDLYLNDKIDNAVNDLQTSIDNVDTNSRSRDEDILSKISNLRKETSQEFTTIREETSEAMELLATELSTTFGQEVVNINNNLNTEINNLNTALDLGLDAKEDLSKKVDTLFGAKPYKNGEYPTAQAVREYVEYYKETKGIEELWQDIRVWELDSGIYKCHGVIYYNEIEYCHSDRSDYTDYSVILLVSKSGGTQLSHTTFMLCYTSSDVDSEFLIPHYKTGFCSVIEGKVNGFIDEIQVVSNLVQDINLNSLATTYPSAKAVYEYCYKMQQRLENALNQLEETFSYIFDVPLAMIGDTTKEQSYINSSSALIGGYETVPDSEKGDSYYTQEDLDTLAKQIGAKE